MKILQMIVRLYYLIGFKDKIILHYNNGYSASKIAKLYNTTQSTILHYLSRWNVDIRKSFYGLKNMILCNDGHKVRSYPEQIIDNFLNECGVLHEVNGVIYSNKKYRFDFFIPQLGLYIEYWGLENTKDYTKRKNRKLDMYKKLNLKLLKIYPEDNFVNKLGIVINKCATKQKALADY